MEWCISQMLTSGFSISFQSFTKQMLELYEQRITIIICILLTPYDYLFDKKSFRTLISIQRLSCECMR